MTHILSGLKTKIDELDTSLPSPDMILSGGARGYSNGYDDDFPYVGDVHFRPVSESWFTHATIQSSVLRREQYQGRLYAGTAGEVNIDYIAASKASGAVLYDVNPWQKVFWDKFWDLLAQHDNPDDFAYAMEWFDVKLSRDLADRFNLEAIRHSQIRNSIQPVEVKLPEIGEYGHIKNEYSSPFRNDRYGEIPRHFRTMAGHPDTGWSCSREIELNWMQNQELYGHLHLLAREGAIAAVTLDISDALSCAELADALAQQEEKIGMLYTSNIPHYLQWTQDEINDHFDRHGETAKDFRGKPVTADMWEKTCKNLRELCADDAYIIRFDQHSGEDSVFANFYPTFSLDRTPNISIPRVLDRGGLIPDIG